MTQAPESELSTARQEDVAVERLLDLARDRSAESRTQLVEIVGDLFFDGNRVLTDRERALMGDILRQLIHDVEMVVRRALSERLAVEADAPLELVATLANDVIEVAYPLLVKSEVLRDHELIEIVKHRTLEHQLAIARRRALSETVAEVLVDTKSEDVITTLLENRGARISQSTLDYLVEESKRVNAFQEPLLHRRELSPKLAKRMYWWVGAALRTYIVENFGVEPTALDEAMEETVHSILGQEKLNGEPPESVADLARRLANENGISPALLIQTLRQGEVSLFEDLFAELTKLRTTLVRRFIFEPGGEGLAIACRGAGIEKQDFASIFLLSRAARPGDQQVDPDEVSRVMNFYEHLLEDTAQKVVRRWRLDPNYLYALKQIDDTGI
jgi:uncharacterized protein (DUF2336 family)